MGGEGEGGGGGGVGGAGGGRRQAAAGSDCPVYCTRPASWPRQGVASKVMESTQERLK